MLVVAAVVNPVVTFGTQTISCCVSRSPLLFLLLFLLYSKLCTTSSPQWTRFSGFICFFLGFVHHWLFLLLRFLSQLSHGYILFVVVVLWVQKTHGVVGRLGSQNMRSGSNRSTRCPLHGSHTRCVTLICLFPPIIRSGLNSGGAGRGSNRS